MEKILMELGAANGIWSALFVFLFIYVLYDSRKREAKYQLIITELSEKFGIVEGIRSDVSFIKEELKRR